MDHGPRTRAITKDPLGQTRGPKLEKTNEMSLRYIKMDQQNNGPTDKDNYIAPLWIKRGSKIRNTCTV